MTDDNPLNMHPIELALGQKISPEAIVIIQRLAGVGPQSSPLEKRILAILVRLTHDVSLNPATLDSAIAMLHGSRGDKLAKQLGEELNSIYRRLESGEGYGSSAYMNRTAVLVAAILSLLQVQDPTWDIAAAPLVD